MSEIAQELARRASPDWVKEQVRERAVKKSYEVKDRMLATPTALSVAGGIFGMLAGRAAGRLAWRKYEADQYDARYPRTYHAGMNYGEYHRTDVTPGIYASTAGEVDTIGSFEAGGEPGRVDELKGKAHEGLESARERIGEVRESARERIDDVRETARERITGAREHASGAIASARWRAHELRGRIPSSWEMRQKARENPSMLAFFGLACGALAGFLLPVTAREERLLSTARDRANREVHRLGDKMQEQLDRVEEQLHGNEEDTGQDIGSIGETSGLGASGAGIEIGERGSVYGSTGLEPPTDTRH